MIVYMNETEFPHKLYIHALIEAKRGKANAKVNDFPVILEITISISIILVTKTRQ